MRKTKIICTVGPACSDEQTLTAMALAGMNVARLNFSHGSHEEHKKRIDLLKKVRAKLNLPIAIMLDTKGPEYRIGVFKKGKETLLEGQEFTFTAENIEGDDKRVSVSYKMLAKELFPGDRVLVNNGLLIFEVLRTEGEDVVCRVLSGGVISDRKSKSFPGKVLKQDYLSAQDKEDLLFGIAQEVDFVACSFVSMAQDLIDVRTFLDANGGKELSLIAKIENRPGVDAIEEITEWCDGIMIGRGDMGVEIPFEELPAIQKKLISKCRMLGKRVITATEMLESMITNPRPTRAEISDVANAVYDGTSAVMLSGETAAGEFPVESVSAMAKIVEQAETHTEYIQKIENFKIKNNADALSHAACNLAQELNAKAIVVCTRTGSTARMVSRFRPQLPIIGLTTNMEAYKKLTLSWGVSPVMVDEYSSVDILFYFAKLAALKSGLVKKGDTIVITGGTANGKSGNTSLINVETV